MLTAEDILKTKEQEIIYVTPEQTIADALKVMLDNQIGAILVKDGDNFVGIWTERDLMKNVVTEGFYSKTSKIKDYMVTDLKTTPSSATIYELIDICLGQRHRHLLIEKEGEIIGVLSGGDINKAQLIEKSKELDKLNKIVDWDYYENWKWKNK